MSVQRFLLLIIIYERGKVSTYAYPTIIIARNLYLQVNNIQFNRDFKLNIYFLFQGEDVRQTSHWFQAIQHYCLALGQWRRRRNGLANIMINGMVRTHHQETQSTMVRSHSMETTSMMRNSSHHLNVAETISLSASVSTITEMSSSNSPFLTS